MSMECYLFTIIGGDCIIAADCIAINDLAAPPSKRNVHHCCAGLRSGQYDLLWPMERDKCHLILVEGSTFRASVCFTTFFLFPEVLRMALLQTVTSSSAWVLV